MRKTNKAGVDLIKRWEGLRLTSYLCPAHVWTIGYGHTVSARKGQTITEAQANDLLKEDLTKFERGVSNLINVPLDDNQFAALVSWAFNVGLGAVERSTLRRKLNAGDYESVPSELRRWNKAGGKVLQGLVNRREDEIKLWLTPVTNQPVETEGPDFVSILIKVVKWFSRLFLASRKS